VSGLRSAGVGAGVLFVLLGAVWIGQGAGYIKGSFMTGQAFWAAAGVASVIVGVGLGGYSALTGRRRVP
jgi:hypothetical protein